MEYSPAWQWTCLSIVNAVDVLCVCRHVTSNLITCFPLFYHMTSSPASLILKRPRGPSVQLKFHGSGAVGTQNPTDGRVARGTTHARKHGRLAPGLAHMGSRRAMQGVVRIGVNAPVVNAPVEGHPLRYDCAYCRRQCDLPIHPFTHLPLL